MTSLREAEFTRFSKLNILVKIPFCTEEPAKI
jgi:hypothetical protein